MHKEACKTAKFVDFKIQKYSTYKYDNSVSFWHGYCLMGNTNVCCPISWDVSHGIPIGMAFLWTSLMKRPTNLHLKQQSS